MLDDAAGATVSFPRRPPAPHDHGGRRQRPYHVRHSRRTCRLWVVLGFRCSDMSPPGRFWIVGLLLMIHLTFCVPSSSAPPLLGWSHSAPRLAGTIAGGASLGTIIGAATRPSSPEDAAAAGGDRGSVERHPDADSQRGGGTHAVTAINNETYALRPTLLPASGTPPARPCGAATSRASSSGASSPRCA